MTTLTQPVTLVTHEPLVTLTLGASPTVLDKLEAHFNKYIFSANDSTGKVLALWTAHTYLLEQLESSPRLHITAPEKGSGKTTVIEHLEQLCHNTAKLDAGITASVMRSIADNKQTILIDEVEKTITKDTDAYGLVTATMNSGYKRNGSTIVNVQQPTGEWLATKVSTFAPVVFSGNGHKLPDDTMSRTIVLSVIKDRKGVVAETRWKLITPIVEKLQSEVEDWAKTVTLPNEVSLPDGCINRLRELYEPLKQIAVVVGQGWPEVVDSLIEEALIREEEEEAAGLLYESPHVTLAKDLFSIFQGEFMRSEDICSALAKLNPHAWGDLNTKYLKLTTHRLGKMLSDAYRISPTRTRLDGVQVRGYARQMFMKIWDTHELTGRGLNKVSQVAEVEQVEQTPQEHYKAQSEATKHDMDEVLSKLGSNMEWN